MHKLVKNTNAIAKDALFVFVVLINVYTDGTIIIMNAQVKLCQNDMLENLEEKYDIIISNPPYIKENEPIEEIVKNNEPHLALYAGIDELDNGIIKLSSGISKFNKEGINNISNLVNTKLKDTSARAEKLIELGENYKSVDSNKNLSGDSETKFVLVVEGQKAKDTTKSNTTKTTKVSLWQRIKNLFK